jgi:hypothetical protein
MSGRGDAKRSTGGEKPIELDGALLTRPMAAMLVAHANGPRPTRAISTELQTLRALRARKLIRFNRATRPTHTVATSRGREIIAALLAAQADALAAQALE